MPVLRGVPVTLDLRETGVLGVIGTGEQARALLRWMLVQLATLRSPDDLRLVLLTSGGSEDITWTRWLPHLDPGSAAAVPCWIGNTDASRAARIDELRQLIAARTADRGSASSPGPVKEVVVVLDGALALRNLPGIRDILHLGPEAGVYVLCADSQGMSECRGVCEVTARRHSAYSHSERSVGDCRPGRHRPSAGGTGSQALAPMRDRISAADVQTAIPDRARLLDLLGIGVPTADDILALWSRKREGPSTRVVLREAAEPFGDRRYALLLDDADRITVQAEKNGFSDSPTLLDEIAHPAQFGHRALIIAAGATPILSGQRRSLAKATNETLTSGTRLLLTPAKRADARQLSMPLEPDQYFARPPGRGYLATTGAPTLIQLAAASPI